MNSFDTTSLKRAGFNMATSLLALVLSFVAGGLLVSIIGVSPVQVYSALLRGGFGGSVALMGTLNRMAPILLAGIALTVGNSCGIFNMGFEGQFLCASYTAVAAGIMMPLPLPLHIPMVLLAGMAGGMLWSVIPITLYLKKDINVVFSSIMLNYVAIFLVDYLIQAFPGYVATSNATPNIMKTADLPLLELGGMKISASVILALVMVFIAYVVMFKTKPGYEMRAVGQNRFAALSAGIPVNMRMLLAMLLSAACAGMSGAVEVMGTTHRLIQNYNPGYMSMGIAVAMLGKQNPVAILVASLLFAAMKNGTILMQMETGVSQQFVLAIQGLIIIFICCDNLFRYLATRQRMKKPKEGVAHA